MIHSQPPNITTIFETRFIAPRPIPYNSGGYGNCLLKRRTNQAKVKRALPFLQQNHVLSNFYLE